LACDTQRKLFSIGKMKGSADLLIAAITINNNEELTTDDKDFIDIANVSQLKLIII
jgi:predicted nucleic acid-binding protein